MPIPLRKCLVPLLALSLSACAHAGPDRSSGGARRLRVLPGAGVSVVDRPDPLQGLNDALAFRAASQRQYLLDVAKVQAVKRAQDAPRARVEPVSRAQGSQWVATGGGAPCDGDLPPCWRIIGTESGGRWDAYNPGGCASHGVVYGCWGPYQFGGFWAGKLGLPADLRTTTKEQWVNAARALWNHGAGCSNWSAC